MGFFPDMAKPAQPGSYRTYVVHVNSLGECVVQRLDDNGGVADFVTAHNPEVMVFDLARAINPRAVVQFVARDRHTVRQWCGIRRTWAGVVAELNRRPRRVAGHKIDATYQATPYDYGTYRRWVDEFIGFRRGEWFVTPAGEAFDREFYPPNEDGAGSPGEG